MFSIVCLTLAARMLTRIYTRRRLYLDDFFILLGFIILSGATYLALLMARSSFVGEAVVTGLIKYVPIKDILGLTDSISVMQAFLCMFWSAVFCVKFSFLALFRVLIRRLSRRVTIYYWVVVGVTIMTWMLLAFDVFIICPRTCKYIHFLINPNDYLIFS